MNKYKSVIAGLKSSKDADCACLYATSIPVVRSPECFPAGDAEDSQFTEIAETADVLVLNLLDYRYLISLCIASASGDVNVCLTSV